MAACVETIMIQPTSLFVIILMACATYATRTLGYIALRNRPLSPRVRTVFDAAPGCVLIAVIAPAFVSPRPADIAALAITLLAAIRLPMIAVVGIAIISSATLRAIFP